MTNDGFPPLDTLTPRKAKLEHKALAAEIAAADLAYFQEDRPVLDDAVYDAKKRRLLALEEAFPELKSAASVQVGAKPAVPLRQDPPSRADAVARQCLCR